MATRKARASARSVQSKKRPSRKRPAKKPAANKSAVKTTAKKKRAPTTTAARKSRRPRTSRGAKTASRRVGTATRTTRRKPGADRDRSAPRKTAPKTTAAPRAPLGASVDPALFPCGDAAIRAATGKDWNEWLTLLDAAGAASRSLDHPRIWDLAMQSLPDSAGWWGQMVSVGYERARGLREKHETGAGDFQATLSKTFEVPLFAAFAAWADAGLRGRWLEAPGLAFTKLNVGKNIRARWPDGARLDIRFNSSAPDKCQIVVDTMKLPSAEAVQEAKRFWQAQFDRLQAYLRG